MKKDLVSIIVPVYNADKFLEETIKSVQEQTYENWELLLVNDCSKDNVEDIIMGYSIIYRFKGRSKNYEFKCSFILLFLLLPFSSLSVLFR